MEEIEIVKQCQQHSRLVRFCEIMTLDQVDKLLVRHAMELCSQRTVAATLTEICSHRLQFDSRIFPFLMLQQFQQHRAFVGDTIHALFAAKSESQTVEELNLPFFRFLQEQTPVTDFAACIAVQHVEHYSYRIVPVEHLLQCFLANGFVIDPLQFT